MCIKNLLSKLFNKKEESETDLVNSLPDIMLLLNFDGEINWANDIAISFFNEIKDEFDPTNINDFLDNGLELIRKSAETKKPIVIRTKSDLGKDLFLEVNASETKENYVVIMRDHTQNYKNLTSILVEHECSKKINKDKNTFLVKLTNELTAPLQTIINLSDVIFNSTDNFEKEQHQKFSKAINNKSTDLLYLIEKLLELSKTESNIFQCNFQLFDAIYTLKKIVNSNKKEAELNSLELKLNIDENVKKMVNSDESLLKIVFQNILETAIKYSKPGEILVEVTHPDLEFLNQNGLTPFENATENSFLMFKITDNSEGLNETELETLFEPYSQIDKPDKKFITRSIAFASVKNIVKNLKGNVWVDSQPNEKSVYNIIIPTEKVTQAKNE